MYYLFNHPLVRSILKTKYQFFRHKFFRWILLLIVTVNVVWSAYSIVLWVKNTYCALSYIIITGKRHYTTNNDIYCIIKKLGTLKTFSIQNIDVIQKKIESLPWIQQVSIRIQWPDTLKMHIIEHIPIAFWNDSQIISVTGIIVDIPKEYYSNNNTVIPMLYGPKGSEQEILAYYYIMNEILKKSAKLQIKSLHMDTRYSWKLMLQNNMYVKLGRNNIIERVNYFVKIYPIIVYKISENDKCVDYIDLRYTAGFAVKWIPNVITSVFCKK